MPVNPINVILYGMPAAAGERGPIMPGFSGALTDAQIADLLTYLRSRFSDQKPWTNIQGQVAAARKGHDTAAQQASQHKWQLTRRENLMVTLTVNGNDHRVDADPDTPLLYVLRDELQLNGAKYGCGLGQCGACTVLVDGEPVFSCVTPALLLEGRKITTVEGLGTVEKPGPMQTAFIEEQAAQCGYCCCRHDDAGPGPAAAQSFGKR